MEFRFNENLIKSNKKKKNKNTQQKRILIYVDLMRNKSSICENEQTFHEIHKQISVLIDCSNDKILFEEMKCNEILKL